MASLYPGASDSISIPSGAATLGGSTPTHTSVHQQTVDAVIAVQDTLGANPQGSQATVVARLNQMNTLSIAYAYIFG